MVLITKVVIRCSVRHLLRSQHDETFDELVAQEVPPGHRHAGGRVQAQQPDAARAQLVQRAVKRDHDLSAHP